MLRVVFLEEVIVEGTGLDLEKMVESAERASEEAFNRGDQITVRVSRSPGNGLLIRVNDEMLVCAEIKTVEYVIDCDTDAIKPPESWEVQTHRKNGQLRWSVDKAEFYFVDLHRKEGFIDIGETCKQLLDKNVANANLLERLKKNPRFIPDQFKSKAILFWGTIYKDPDGNLHVRCLYQHPDGNWDWCLFNINGHWAFEEDAPPSRYPIVSLVLGRQNS